MHAKVLKQQHAFREQQGSQCGSCAVSKFKRLVEGGRSWTVLQYCRNVAFSLNEMGGFRAKEWYSLSYIIKRQLWLMYWD